VAEKYLRNIHIISFPNFTYEETEAPGSEAEPKIVNENKKQSLPEGSS